MSAASATTMKVNLLTNLLNPPKAAIQCPSLPGAPWVQAGRAEGGEAAGAAVADECHLETVGWHLAEGGAGNVTGEVRRHITGRPNPEVLLTGTTSVKNSVIPTFRRNNDR